MAWTLEYDGTTQPLEAWGADSSATLSLQNQAAGVLTLHCPGMMDADVPWAYKGKVILRLGDEIVFRGVAMEPHREGEGENEGITMTFVDAWWFLTNGTLTQTIFDKGQTADPRSGTLTNGSADVTLDTTGLAVGMAVAGTGVPTGALIASIGTGSITLSANATVDGAQSLRFVLGASSNLYALFSRLSLGEVSRLDISTTLSDIIAACDAHHGGGVIAFGACHGDGFAITPQPVDVQGTFATALQAALGWVPDAVPVFNYTPDPPELSFYQRGAATVQSLAFADESVMISQDIQERRDLLITGVRIIYHRYLVDGTLATTIDAAGAETGPGIVQAEMTLYAPTSLPRYVAAVTEKQWLKSVPTIIDSTDWWFKNADLGVSRKEDISLSSTAGDQAITLDPDAPENEGITGDDLNDVSGCDKRIVEGSIPAWLSDTAHLRYIRVKGYLQLTFWRTPGDYTDANKLAVVQRRIALNFAATDLGTNTYENTITDAHMEGGSFDPEAPPSGVAAAILAAQSVLQYQGEVTLTDEECDVSFAPGQVLNVTGSDQAAWATMKAQIQSVTHQLQTGTTQIAFGPAENLAPQDYLEITRRIKRLQPALDLATRADETPSEEGGGGDGAVHHPSTQIRYGIQQSDMVQSKKDVDSAGSIERVTASGKQVWSDGTTTIKVDCSGTIFSMETEGGRKAIINLSTLPEGAVLQPRSQNFCEGGVTKTAYVMMTEPA